MIILVLVFLVIIDNSSDGVGVSGDPGWILLLQNQVLDLSCYADSGDDNGDN